MLADNTPLLSAAAAGQAEVIALLLVSGASVAATNGHGEDCLLLLLQLATQQR
jgi:ankyrin repeat protein